MTNIKLTVTHKHKITTKQINQFSKGLGSRKQVSNLRNNTTLFSLKQDMFRHTQCHFQLNEKADTT